MTGNEWFRWAILMACCANIGACLAFYGRAKKLFLPRIWMRLIGVANIVIVSSVAAIIWSHLAAPVNWRHLGLAAGVALEDVAIIGLWHWYGTDAGQEHARRVIAGDAPTGIVPVKACDPGSAECLVKRVVVGMVAIAAFVIFVLCIVLWQADNTRKETARTHNEERITRAVQCSQRSDLAQRVADAIVSVKAYRAFVKAHPKGITFGADKFTHAQLLANQHSQERTLGNQQRALNAIDRVPGFTCPTPTRLKNPRRQ